MTTKIAFFTVIITLLASCNNVELNQQLAKVPADSLIANITKYCNTKVEIEGVIIHICGVDGKKIKLQTESGAIIKIVPHHSLERFDGSFNKKRVKVQGIVTELRVEIPYIDSLENEKALLCHIDHTPCKDSAWVNQKKRTGVADSLSKRGILKLKQKMEQTQKSYVSVITITAEKCEIAVEVAK
jgi:hypothetical protein